jgi:hypothetical protein
MVEVDASLELTGPDGPVTLLDAFEGRRDDLTRSPASYTQRGRNVRAE